MLRAIKTNTDNTQDDLELVSGRVTIVENKATVADTDIITLKQQVQELQISNKTLTGRLIRTEIKLGSAEHAINDLTSRSMRDNIIIKTCGPDYSERRNEDTTYLIRKFLATEMRVPDVDKITILRAHRMGQAGNGFNRPMIAKFAFDCDIKRVFSNAKCLKGTNHSISTQIPAEFNERRQFAWSEYKTAKSNDKDARFVGPQLLISGERVGKFDPLVLPPSSLGMVGQVPSKEMCGLSEQLDVKQHSFQAVSLPVNSLQDVRNSIDSQLQSSDLSQSDHMPYAFRFEETSGRLSENFSSDGDYGAGLQLLRSLRKQNAKNIVCVTAHYTAGSHINFKGKMDALNTVVCGSLLALQQNQQDSNGMTEGTQSNSDTASHKSESLLGTIPLTE